MPIKYYAATSNQQPATSNQQPATSNQQPATSNQQPAKPASTGAVMHTSSIYLRFLNLSQAITSEFEGVDLTTLRLLETIAVAHTQGKPLTVTNAMALSAIASPATLHRKMDALREAGLIDQVFEGTNRRTKYLAPTNACQIFRQHGQGHDHSLKGVMAKKAPRGAL
jgi:DNA-binding transcriptional ArsR family regulator